MVNINNYSSNTLTITTVDDTAPQVLNISYNPSSVDLTNGPQTVTISGDFVDDQSDLERVYFTLRGTAAGGTTNIGQCNLFPDDGVTSVSHSCSVTIPDTFASDAMDWIAYAKDEASNEIFSVVATIQVTNNNYPDVFAPQVSNISYTPSIDLTNGPQTVTISGDFTDINEYRTSDLERVYFVLRGMAAGGTTNIDQCDLFPGDGVTSVSHSCTFTVPDTFATQTMELRAYAKDKALNVLSANVGSVSVTNNG